MSISGESSGIYFLDIDTDEHGHRARVSIQDRETVQTSYTYDDLIACLHKAGIDHGIIESKVNGILNRINRTSNGTDDITIAKSTNPVHGEDGFVEFMFDPDLKAGKPREDQQMDFREREFINNVHEGDTLAIVHDPTPGNPGTNIYGEEIPAQPGEEANHPTAGRNVLFDEQDQCYYAEADGHASLQKQKLTVQTQFTHNGDVDYETGNLDFLGDIHITGSVKAGFRVKAHGNVTIEGDVIEKATVISGQNITIQGIIKCGDDEEQEDEGSVRAIGTITCDRAYNSFLKSRDDIIVRELLVNCRVVTSEWFLCKQGEVRGAEIKAAAGMIIHTVGSDGNVPGSLTVGCSYEAMEQIKQIRKEQQQKQEELKDLRRKFQARYGKFIEDSSQIARLPDHTRNQVGERIKEYYERVEALETRLEELEQQKKDREEELHQDQNASIRILEECHPVTKLHIQNASMEIRTSPMTNFECFYDHEAQTIRTREHGKSKA